MYMYVYCNMQLHVLCVSAPILSFRRYKIHNHNKYNINKQYYLSRYS